MGPTRTSMCSCPKGTDFPSPSEAAPNIHHEPAMAFYSRMRHLFLAVSETHSESGRQPRFHIRVFRSNIPSSLVQLLALGIDSVRVAMEQFGNCASMLRRLFQRGRTISCHAQKGSILEPVIPATETTCTIACEPPVSPELRQASLYKLSP